MPENLELRNKTWYFRAMIDGRLYRRSTGFHDLKSAKRRASDFERDIRAGVVWGEKPVPTFETWTETCLRILTGGKKDPARDTNSVQHALKRWASCKLTDIRPTDCEDYIQARLLSGAARGTVAREVVILVRMFRMAVNDELLKRNPWAEVRRVTGDARDRVLTLEEERRLRAHLADPFERYLTVALATGLREAEQLHLRPIDIRDGIIWVQGEHAKRGKGRVVPLRPEAKRALEGMWPIHPEARFWPQTSNILRYFFRKAGDAAGLTRFHVHDLRRTFATRAAESGMLLVHLQQILGHASPQTTAKYYIHLQRLSLVEAMQKVTIPMVIDTEVRP